MFADHVRNQVVRETCPTSEALWKTLNQHEDQLCVVDADDKYVGMLGRSDFPTFAPAAVHLAVGDICNRRATYIDDGPYAWHQARSAFLANRNLRLLAVVDGERNITDVLFRFQVFYDKFFNAGFSVPSALAGSDPVPGEMVYPQYAYCLQSAALEARQLGYPKISAIEFGVSQGRGLTALEWHSLAVERMYGVKVEVYGFDTGQGLPELSDDYREPPYLWRAGAHTMRDPADLESRLIKARMVFGDVKDTGPNFFADYRPAPIGAMFVDVDLYSSTVSVLNMLHAGDDHFLPRVFMYFDDIFWNTSFTGEALAIKEFNAASQTMKISPEDFYGTFTNGNCFTDPIDVSRGLWLTGIKTGHRFHHPKYKEHSWF